MPKSPPDIQPIKDVEERDTSLVSTLTGPIRNHIWSFIEFIKIDAIYEAQCIRKRQSSNRPNIQGMTRVVKQEVSALKCLGITLINVVLLYFGLAVFNAVKLSRSKFRDDEDHEWTGDELYEYSKDLTVMKVVHSSILLGLAIAIVCLTTKNKVSKKHRYTKILRLTMVAELTYILPLVYNVKKSLDEK